MPLFDPFVLLLLVLLVLAPLLLSALVEWFKFNKFEVLTVWTDWLYWLLLLPLLELPLLLLERPLFTPNVWIVSAEIRFFFFNSLLHISWQSWSNGNLKVTILKLIIKRKRLTVRLYFIFLLLWWNYILSLDTSQPGALESLFGWDALGWIQF